MIVIAEADESHLPQIVELWKELTDFHAERDPHFTRAEDGHVHFEKHLRGLLGSAEWHVLVALDGERVVGYAMGQLARKPPVFKETAYGLISDLVVTAAYRRRSIGQDLLTETVAWFAEHGLRRAEVRVATCNEVAQAFWDIEVFKDFMAMKFIEIDPEDWRLEEPPDEE